MKFSKDSVLLKSSDFCVFLYIFFFYHHPEDFSRSGPPLTHKCASLMHWN